MVENERAGLAAEFRGERRIVAEAPQGRRRRFRVDFRPRAHRGEVLASRTGTMRYGTGIACSGRTNSVGALQSVATTGFPSSIASAIPMPNPSARCGEK